MATRQVARQVTGAQRAALDAALSGAPAPSAARLAGRADAPMVVTLPPSAFSPTWKGKPSEPVRIGLRLVSESVVDKARATATSSADRFYAPTARDSESYVEHWNGQLIREILAEAVCQEHDVASSWFKTMPSEMVHIAFVEKGVLRLWQGYAELREKLSPLLRLATAEDLTDLSTRLAAADVMGRLDDGDRRIIARILDDLRDQI